jgi:WD40 repeat protein
MAAHTIKLELARTEQSADPFALRFAPQEYVVRTPGGSFPSVAVPWGEEMLDELVELRRPSPDPAVIQRVGDRLRSILEPAGWAAHEAAIAEAIQQKRPVFITIRSAAAEIYALPWELLTIKSTGQHLGEIRSALLRYEWPETQAAPEAPDPRPEGGRILVAWSAAGGAVPAAEHIDAIKAACAEGHYDFDPARDVLPHLSTERLFDALQKAQERAPVSALHILCHGAAAGQTFGLAWDDDGGSVVDPGRLRRLLAPYAGMVRAVVLCACESGDAGSFGNHLGSAAQTLHRSGFQAVIASRFPLSSRGSTALTSALYGSLLPGSSSLESAFLAARERLTRGVSLDWASVQLYASDASGDDTRPLVVRPYRGLFAFHASHRRFFFGRDEERIALRKRVEEAISGDRPRLQIVAGASGTGKSSLVLAGLLPDLEAIPDAHWHTASFRLSPRTSPLAALQSALKRVRTGSEVDDAAADSPGALTPAVIVDEARRLREARPGRSLLLVLDQFEEIFTLGVSGPDQDALMQALWALSTARDLALVVVLTMRVDFIGRCGEIAINDGDKRVRFDALAYEPARVFFIPQIGIDKLASIIEAPAAKVGLRFEPGLAERIRDDIGDDMTALPLLQYALDTLWMRRRGSWMTQSAYLELGGWKGALVHAANGALDTMSPDELHQARRVMVRMVNLAEGEGADTRRRAWTDHLRPVDPARAAAFDRALSALVATRLVVVGDELPEDPREGAYAELAHEMLIRVWARLREWVEEDRAILRQIADLRRAADEWTAHRLGPHVQDYLLKREKLEAGCRMRDTFADDLASSIVELINASDQAEKLRLARAKRRKRGTIIAVASAAATVVALGVILVQASSARQVASDRALREAQARASVAEQASLAAMLAKRDPTLAVSVLRECPLTELWLRGVHDVDGQPIAESVIPWKGRSAPHDIRVSADGKRILARFPGGEISAWEWESGAPLYGAAAGKPDVKAIAESPAPHRRITRGGTARLDVPVALPYPARALAVAWSPDGERIAGAYDDGVARIVRAAGVGEPLVLQHGGAVRSVAFSADGQRLVTASSDTTARVWERDRAVAVLSFSHRGAVTAAAFGPDGRRVVTACEDGTIRVWKGDVLRLSTEIAAPGSAIRSAALSADGARAITASNDGKARIFDLESERAPIVIDHGAPIVSSAFSPDGSRVATAVRSEARVYRADGEGSPVVLDHGAPVISVAWSADSTRVASVSSDLVRLHRADGQGAHLEIKPGFPLWTVGLSSDGHSLIAVGPSGVRFYALDGPEVRHPIDTLKEASSVLNINPETGASSWSGSYTWEGRIELWKAADESGEPALWSSGRDGSFRLGPGLQRLIPSGRGLELVRNVILPGERRSVVAAAVMSADGARVLGVMRDVSARVVLVGEKAILARMQRAPRPWDWKPVVRSLTTW